MIWVAVATLGFAAWLSIALFFLALCHAAGRADDRSGASLEADWSGYRHPEVIDLRAIRGIEISLAGATAGERLPRTAAPLHAGVR